MGIFKGKRAIQLFIKSFFITIAVTLLASGGIWLAVSGWSAVSNTVSPPEVPNIPVVVLQPNSPFRNEPSSNASLVNSGLTGLDDELLPPHLVQFEERRPSFFTFLIFGLTEGRHANTIMVAAYDAESRQAYVISIPRDTRVDFERTRRKIVNAYPVGYGGGRGHEGGVERMRHEVSTLIGFRPDFYISIDYEAFVSMIDAVGGVEIDVPFRMFYNDPAQSLHIDLQAGLQVLNGHDALHFARYRTGTRGISPTISDYQRIEHQQQVVSAVMRELLTPASILRIPEFIGIFNEYVNTDLAMGDLMWFATQARYIGGLDAVHFYTLPMAGTSGAPAWYELADERGILELVNRTVNPLVRDITSNDVSIVR
ncbi:MAG: LCP family protein [Defluviitaleaceae bacterium]|nr:LCP family protein [Defluviitaleaceae bacterium]